MDNDGRTADHPAEIDDSIVSLIARLGHPRPGYQVARSCGSNSFLLRFWSIWQSTVKRSILRSNRILDRLKNLIIVGIGREIYIQEFKRVKFFVQFARNANNSTLPTFLIQSIWIEQRIIVWQIWSVWSICCLIDTLFRLILPLIVEIHGQFWARLKRFWPWEMNN